MLFFRRPIIPKFNFSADWYLAWGKVEHLQGKHPSKSELGIIWQDTHLAVYGQFNSLSNPPLAFSFQQNVVVIGDVWLSNRPYLLKHLNLKLEPETITDLQIIAYLWERYGSECLQLLQGMFGFAIWHRDQQQLWLCRDPVGARTLYYTTTDGICYIAARLSTLSPWRSADLDLVALRDYLCCAFVPGDRTLWQQVKELRPGTSLQLPEQIVTNHWQLKEQIIDRPLEWHGQQLRSLLEQIIQAYLLQNQPIGAFLSGGLDSSCVTAIAAKFHNQPIHTYSIHFGKDCPHELEFSDLVAQHCRTQHHTLEITPEMMWENLPETMAHLDDPIGDPLTVPNFLLGKLAKDSVSVILNGEGGDPCFGGPKNQPMLLNRLYGEGISNPKDLLSAYLISFQKCASQLQQLLKPQVWQAICDFPSVFTDELNADASYLNRLMMLNIKFKGADQILTKVNNLTQAHQLSGRSPLFDWRVVEMSMQIPPEFKLSGAVEKAVLRQAVADLLPEVILTRPKSGMMVPVQLWFREQWQKQAKALLLHPQAAIADYLNQSLIKEWLAYRGDPWSRYGVKLWLLVSLEIWLQVNRKT